MCSFLSKITKEEKGGDFKSYNCLHYCDNYKIIIVGTITPPSGRKDNTGFFYMSRSNSMYKILDKFFEKKGIKTEFQKNHLEWNITQLKKDLSDKGILFLDTVKSCQNPKESHKDNDLESIQLDYQSFKNIKDNAIVVANSINAFFSLLMIMRANKLDHKIHFCKLFYGHNQEEWNSLLEKAGV